MEYSVRPSRQNALMAVAEVLSTRSTCSRAAVGVVIAREGRILSTGYNGAPAGLEHCNHECDCLTEKVMMGTGVVVREIHQLECNSLIPCTVAIHAEANAIGYAARYGTELQGAELYTTFCPCLPCSQLIVTVGICKVFYRNNYRDQSGLELLRQAKIDMISL